MSDSHQPIQKVTDLLFFDNLALHYVVINTPQNVLARVMNTADARLAGSILGLLNVKERQELHAMMAAASQNPDADKDRQSAQALVLIAGDQYARGLIRKQGPHYIGTPQDQDLKRPQI